MSKAIELTDSNIGEIIASNKITVVDFHAVWCGPCKMIGPIIEQLAIENTDVAIGKMNVDENKETPSKMGIRGIPTIIFYKDGVEAGKVVGMKSKADLQAIIDSLKA